MFLQILLILCSNVLAIKDTASTSSSLKSVVSDDKLSLLLRTTGKEIDTRPQRDMRKKEQLEAMRKRSVGERQAIRARQHRESKEAEARMIMQIKEALAMSEMEENGQKRMLEEEKRKAHDARLSRQAQEEGDVMLAFNLEKEEMQREKARVKDDKRIVHEQQMKALREANVRDAKARRKVDKAERSNRNTT